LHTADEDVRYFSEQVLEKRYVLVARDHEARIVGFIAFDKKWISHLYLLPEFIRRAIGRRLLNIAKAQNERSPTAYRGVLVRAARISQKSSKRQNLR
jgi:GNAT superfamily N-acetyltransferase